MTSPDQPPTLEQLADAWAAQQAVDDHLADLLRRWHQSRLGIPVTLHILIGGRRSTIVPTPVNDVRFFAQVEARDAAGRIAVDVGPFTWTVVPPEAATVGPDTNFSGDTSHVEVVVTPPDATGNQAPFTLDVSDGERSGSEACSPTPGAPTTLTIVGSAS